MNSSAEIRIPEEQKQEPAPLISTSPKNVDHSTMTEENADHPDILTHLENEESIPLQILSSFQESLSTKFSEMLRMHRDIMLELINKELSRDEQVKAIIQEISELTKRNTVLQIENANLKNKFKEF